MRRIVTGIADIERCDDTLIAALALARRFGAELELVHAVQGAASHWPLAARARLRPTWNEDALRIAGDRLSAHLRARRSDGTTFELRGTPAYDLLRVELGAPAAVLLGHARHGAADLIVLGRHRQRVWFHFGRTARCVLAKASCPVWVQAGPPNAIRHVLAPIDLSEHSVAVLRMARDMAKGLGARLTALYCFVHPGLVYAVDAAAPIVTAIEHVDELRRATLVEFERRMESFDWQDVEHDGLFVDDDPIHGILARQDASDLIAMGSHGDSALKSAILGSTAYGVLAKTYRPVLVLAHPGRAEPG